MWPFFRSVADHRDAIEKFISEGIEENKTVVLVIDEDKTVLALEILRTLLNYETNDRNYCNW